jgi:hypothetical protein
MKHEKTPKVQSSKSLTAAQLAKHVNTERARLQAKFPVPGTQDYETEEK